MTEERRKIRIECTGADAIDVRKILPYQGDLKELTTENYELLKESILSVGFSEPMSVWPKSGEYFLFNGHQRLAVLQRMKADGFEVPLIPVSLVMAKTAKEAKLKVLALAGMYGRSSAERVAQFAKDNDIQLGDFQMFYSSPDVKMEDVVIRLEGGTPEAPQDDESESNHDSIGPCHVVPGELFLLGGHFRCDCGERHDL
jgi:hypothetical protein